jgi:hypothetical protein
MASGHGTFLYQKQKAVAKDLVLSDLEPLRILIMPWESFLGYVRKVSAQRHPKMIGSKKRQCRKRKGSSEEVLTFLMLVTGASWATNKIKTGAGKARPTRKHDVNESNDLALLFYSH